MIQRLYPTQTVGRFFIGSLFSLFTSFVVAESLHIDIRDQQGQPLQNAVVELKVSISNEPAGTDVLVMDQVDKRFLPHVLVVPVGQAVEFPNSDNIRHHVYSFSRAKPFELKLYSGKPEAPINFDQAGVVVLGCNIHDSMVGYLYVTESPFTQVSDENGSIFFKAVPGEIDTLWVWHPESSEGPETRIAFNIKQLRDESGRLKISLTVNEPAPRDTFEALYRDAN